MGDWHYLLSALDGTPNAGDQVGPVPWANLEREYGGGNLINESMVWGPSLPGWTVINDAPDIKAKLNPAPAPAPPPPRPVAPGDASGCAGRRRQRQRQRQPPRPPAGERRGAGKRQLRLRHGAM
jgi:hypothetical protein